MSDLVVVSMHERGFPQGDYYIGMGEMPATEFEAISPSPDGFFTMSVGDTIEQAKAFAAEQWPEAVIVEAADEDEDEDEC